MSTMERARDRGRRHARDAYAEIANELREARRAAGLSQRHVAQVAGLSQSRISLTERLQPPVPRVDELAAHGAALGMRLTARLFPEASPVRDEAQLRLLERVRRVTNDSFLWRSEVLVGGRGDLRAWDVVLSGPAVIAIDAETRLHDVQALQRRSELKLRDSGLPCLVLVVADTAHNRAVLREHRAALLSTFPLEGREVLAALRAGRAPRGNGIVLL